MPVDLRQISFYPLKRQFIVSDSEPGIEVVQSGSGAYLKCTDENDAVIFQVANDGLISSAAGQAEYSTLSSTSGNPITLVATGANQDVRFMHTALNTANVMGFFDGTTKHLQIGGLHNDTPDSRLHAIGVTAGSVTAQTDTIITAENDDNAYISLLAPTASGIYFGDVADNDIGRLTYTHGNNALNLFVSASQQFTYTDGQLQFNKATNVRTSSGGLTLQPVSGAHLNLTLGGAGDLRINTNQLYVDTSAARVGVNTATPSASLEIVAAESATVPALMVQNAFDAVSNQVAVFKGSNRGTAADNDSSYISYMMEDASGSSVEVGRQIWQINDVTANTKDSKFTWQVMVNNTLTDMLEISSSAAAVPTATFASGDAIFNDNVSIRLGTAGVEADLSSNGTDVKWEFAATADLLIGRASSPAPDGLVHIWAASAGSVQAPTDSLLTLEKNDNAYLTFLAPTASGIYFGDAADNNVGSITYTHSGNTLNTTINAISQLNYTDGAFAFQKTTTISSTGTLQIAAFTATGAINFNSQAMTGIDINSGNIGGVTIDGTSTVTADMTFNDNIKVTLGTGGDADVYYDATDMVINTRVVGTGDLITHSQLVWGTGVAVTAADYSVGRDADGTNQMHLNVPTGAGWEYSINDTAKLTYATGAFNFTEATSITTSAGQLTIDGAGGVVINEDGDDEDFRIETNSNANTLVIDAGSFGGVGSIGLGNAVVNTAYLRIAPIAIASTAGTSYSAVRIAPVGVTVPSGTSPVVASLHVVEPVISATGTVTSAATVYIQNAPTEGGSANHALMVAAGSTSLAGTLTATGGGSLTGTWSDLGTVTTVDINGGTIDGVTLGTNAAITNAVIDDVAINGKVITMTGSASDLVTMTAATNGAFSLVTVDNAAAAANIQITADGTVDIDSAGVLTLDSGAAINLEPASGSAILLDGTISVDAGVVTGAASITSTAFLGTLDGVIGGNTPAAITGTAIIGTTIDATTDFTIGSLVITDDSIVMTPTASDTVTIAGAANGAFSIVTVDAAAAAANIQITADGTVDIDSAGVLTLDSGAAINIEPANGSAILLDGTISVDAGVVTGATSITSTNFVGTVTTATQNSITTMTGLVTTSALDAGSITSNFGNINNGGSTITTTGAVTTGALAINGNITTAAARTWTMLDNNATALSFDASGKTGMLVFDTRNGSERVTLSGNVLVSGDFEVAGSSTTVSTTVIVADPLVALATTNTGNAVDIGFFGRYRTNGTNLYTGFVWDADASKYRLFHGNQAAPTTTVNTGGTGYTASTLVLGTLETTNVTATNINAFTLAGKLTAGSTEIEGSNFDINGGTVDAITTLTVANNVDVGNYKVTAKAFEASDLTAGRITFAGTAGLLADDSDLTFATDTLTATKIGAFEAAGAINFANQNMTNVDIDSGDMTGVTISGALTWSAAQDLNNQALTNVNIDSGNMTGVTVSGSLTWGAHQDFVTYNVTTGGLLKIDTDSASTGTGQAGAVGTLTMGVGADLAMYHDGSHSYITNTTGDFIITTDGGSGAGIILDAEDDTVEIKYSGTTGATFSGTGLNVVSGDYYSINGASVLNATTLGSAVVGSSLTGVGTIATGTWAATDVAVAHGGTGVSTLADNAVLTGTGTSAITAEGNLTFTGSLLTVTGSTAITATSYIGDTANANVTLGLTINQSTNDNQILALKSSSDVAHGVTTVAETDTYGAFLKTVAGSGGLTVIGLSEGEVATQLSSIYTTDDTGKAASSNAAVEINAQKKDGTGVAAMGSNANILALRNNGSSRFLFDAEGDFYADASINADYYDDYNDPVLVRDLDLAITNRFDNWVQYNKTDIEKAKLAHFDEDGKPFVNWTRVWKLHNGAIWQLNEKLEKLEEENKALRSSIDKMLSEG